MKIHSLLFLFLVAFFSVNKTKATSQIPDFLIIENDTLAINSNPLEPYFEKNPIRDGIITSMSTGLWRGYIAYFKFNDGKLVVENIYTLDSVFDEATGYHKEKLTSVYKDVFGENRNFECDFYSGVLICPFGEVLQYVHMGYSSIYENYRLIEIKDGNYIKEKEVDSEEFMSIKISHYEHFKKTPEYKKQLEETILMFKEAEKELNLISEEDKRRKKKNKYLYEKEKEIEAIKSAERFLFVFLIDNIKTIDLPK